MYDYLNAYAEELQKVLYEDMIDEINWIFAEATQAEATQTELPI